MREKQAAQAVTTLHSLYREHMMTQASARKFSEEWQQSWNDHDIDSIMSHYAEGIVLVSPVAEKLLGYPKVEGAEAVREYFMKGLRAYPDLRFAVVDILCGNQSIVLLYVNQDGVQCGEFMEFDARGKISRMYAHYSR